MEPKTIFDGTLHIIYAEESCSKVELFWKEGGSSGGGGSSGVRMGGGEGRTQRQCNIYVRCIDLWDWIDASFG